MTSPLNDVGIQPELKAILIAPPQADSVAATIEDFVLDFNALLAKLRLVGILST